MSTTTNPHRHIDPSTLPIDLMILLSYTRAALFGCRNRAFICEFNKSKPLCGWFFQTFLVGWIERYFQTIGRYRFLAKSTQLSDSVQAASANCFNKQQTSLHCSCVERMCEVQIPSLSSSAESFYKMDPKLLFTGQVPLTTRSPLLLQKL